METATHNIWASAQILVEKKGFDVAHYYALPWPKEWLVHVVEDLRSPLTIIYSALENLQALLPHATEQQTMAMDVALRNTLRLNHMVDQFFLRSAIDAEDPKKVIRTGLQGLKKKISSKPSKNKFLL